MNFISRWFELRRQRREAERKAERDRREYLAQQLIREYPGLDPWIARAFYCYDVPALALAASDAVMRFAKKRETEALLRRVIREELDKGDTDMADQTPNTPNPNPAPTPTTPAPTPAPSPTPTPTPPGKPVGAMTLEDVPHDE